MQLADKLDNSTILNYSLGLMGSAYLAYFFITKGFNLNLNVLIFIFLILGIIAHGNLIKYTKAVNKGAVTAAGIILQYPFYAGIMGIMKGTGLAFVMSDWLLKLSSYRTFELCCYFSSLIISVFIPSAGGHWVVQAPFMLPAAATLNVEPWKVAMGVAWGESIWNIVCPFWALPLLAIANISIRDLIGFLGSFIPHRQHCGNNRNNIDSQLKSCNPATLHNQSKGCSPGSLYSLILITPVLKILYSHVAGHPMFSEMRFRVGVLIVVLDNLKYTNLYLPVCNKNSL